MGVTPVEAVTMLIPKPLPAMPKFKSFGNQVSQTHLSAKPACPEAIYSLSFPRYWV